MYPVMIEDILSAHADALNQGVDHTEWLRERYAHTAVDSTQTQHLDELLHLARLLKRALVPQPAPPEFTTQLRTNLNHATATTPPVAEPPRWLMGAAFLFSLVAGWLGWRYWRRTTEKSAPPQPTLHLN